MSAASRQMPLAEAYAAIGSCRSLGKLGMTERRVIVIPNAVRDLYIAVPAYAALCEHPLHTSFFGMYAAIEPYRSLDCARDDRAALAAAPCSGAYQAPPSRQGAIWTLDKLRCMSAAARDKCHFAGAYAAIVSHRSLDCARDGRATHRCRPDKPQANPPHILQKTPEARGASGVWRVGGSSTAFCSPADGSSAPCARCRG